MAILFANWEKDIMEKMEGTMKKRLYQALLGLVLSASVAAGGFFAAVPQTAYAQNVATDLESGYHLADNVQDGVILHCFDWTYRSSMNCRILQKPDFHRYRHLRRSWP